MNKIEIWLEVNMNRIIFIYFAICFLLFTLGLSAQDTWIKTYNPFYADTYSTEDVLICQDGGYVVNGYYEIYDPPYFDERWGFMIKTDSDGNLLWAKRDTVSFMSENESLAIIETNDGGFISAGSSPFNSYLLKRDSQGNRLWTTYNNFHVESMCKTFDGNIVLGGVTIENGYPGIRKITQEAEVLWTIDYNLSGSGIGRVNSIIQTSDGGFASTGYTSGNGFDLFVLKTDANGDSLWSITYDGFGEWDEGYCLLEDSESDLFISGYLEFSVSVHYGFLLKSTGQGEQIYILTDNNSDSYYGCNSMKEIVVDGKIVCYGRDEDGPALNAYNYEGESLWVSSLSGWGAAGDECLQQIGNGFVLCGITWSYIISLTKTNSNGHVTAINENLIEIPDKKLQNYPNPFNPFTKIKFNVFHPSRILLTIYNIKGQIVDTLIDEHMMAGEHSIIWDANNQPSGIYFIRLSNETGLSQSRKIILLK